MNNCKICISIVARTADLLYDRIRRAVRDADIIEIRFDSLDDNETASAIAGLPIISKQYLFTYRPRSEGGARELTRDQRLAFWQNVQSSQSLNDDFLVDLESDIAGEIKFPPARTIVSSHNFGRPRNVHRVLATLGTTDAGVIKIAENAESITDGIDVFRLLEQAPVRPALVPIAMGEAGKWTRILGPAHGAHIAYASLDNEETTAPGQITAAELTQIFRVKQLDKSSDVYGVVAGDTSYSISPYLQNAAFNAALMNSVFVPLQVADLDEFMRRMVKAETRELDLNFRGFAVTNPHKVEIMRHLDHIDEVAEGVGAVNTVKIIDGRFHGYNTDAEGFIGPLQVRVDTLDKTRVAVVGAGGAARACIYALQQVGANVTIFARDPVAVERLGKFNVPIKQFSHERTDSWLDGYDILVNTTPTGTKGLRKNESIATAEQLRGIKLVYDLVYVPSETLLSRMAQLAGVPFIDGREMLIAQGARQFEIWTGRAAPVADMKVAVDARLGV